MRTATPLPRVSIDARARTGEDRLAGSPGSTPRHLRATVRALGALGLLGGVATVFLLVAGTAGEPSQYVPGRSGGWPQWLAGPLEGLHMSIDSNSFQNLMLIMCASYLVVLLTARALPLRPPVV